MSNDKKGKTKFLDSPVKPGNDEWVTDPPVPGQDSNLREFVLKELHIYIIEHNFHLSTSRARAGNPSTMPRAVSVSNRPGNDGRT
jgi:hypothetical protein